MFQRLRNLLVKFLQWLLGHKPEGASSVSPTSPTNVLAVMAVAPPQYRLRKSLCTYGERIFYEALRESVGNEYLISIKVRMGDIIWLENEKDVDRERIFKTQI